MRLHRKRFRSDKLFNNHLSAQGKKCCNFRCRGLSLVYQGTKYWMEECRRPALLTTTTHTYWPQHCDPRESEALSLSLLFQNEMLPFKSSILFCFFFFFKCPFYFLFFWSKLWFFVIAVKAFFNMLLGLIWDGWLLCLFITLVLFVTSSFGCTVKVELWLPGVWGRAGANQKDARM